MCVWEEPVTPSRASVGATSLGSIPCQYQRLEAKPLKGFKVQEVTAPTTFPAASFVSQMVAISQRVLPPLDSEAGLLQKECSAPFIFPGPQTFVMGV